MRSPTFHILAGFCSWILVLFCVELNAQECDIKNSVMPDGSMWYRVEEKDFYITSEKKLRGGILTDGDRYYLYLKPFPLIPKSKKKDLRADAVLQLTNGASFHLKNIDAQFQADTAVIVLYLIEESQLEPFRDYPVQSATLPGADGKPVDYNFVLHKETLREQLACFIENRKKKKH